MIRLVRARAFRLSAPLAVFAADGGEFVRRRGLIFRAGSYPDKHFDMSPDDLRAAFARFKPVPIDLGHPSSASPMDGHFGTLDSVELSADATELYGIAVLPKWLDDRLGDARRFVSAAWHPVDKTLKKLSLVTNPRIGDAELTAAFAAHECSCHSHPQTTEAPAMPTRKQQIQEYLGSLPDDEDIDEESLAGAAGMSYTTAAEAVTDDDDPDIDAGDDVEDTENFSLTDAATLIAEQQRQIAELKAQNAQAQEVAFAADADAFLAMVSDRLTAGQRGLVRADLIQAARDDRDAGTPSIVTFGADGKPRRRSRLENRKAAILAGFANPLYAEMVRNDPLPGHRVLEGDPAAEFSAETDEQAARRINARYMGRDRIAGANGN